MINWRYMELRRAGYDKVSASIIAHSSADLHQALEMYGKTDNHTAVRILS